MEINKKYLGYFGDLPKRKKTRGVVIHHTCTANPARTRSVLKDEGFSTHFEVDKDGTIYQYAELDRQCSHCKGNNHRTVGVDFTHLKDAPFTEAQLNAGRELFQWLSKELGIPLVLYEDLPKGFFFHRALCETACPQDFPAWVVEGK